MSRGLRTTVGAGVTLLFFILLAWLAGRLLGLAGWDLWIMRGSLVLLGCIGAGLLGWYLWRSAPPPHPDAAADEGPDDVALALAQARARLARSPSAPTSKLSKLPLVLVLGPPESTKTTLVSRTGMEPDLLAGEVDRGDTVVPTEGVNVWYHDRTIFLEVGGALLADEGRWRRLLRRLRPSRLAAVFGRGRQAPRTAVVCLGADELLKPGAGESVPARARQLRQRLAELSRDLGISVPVYVVFTRADRLPFFADFVRNLSQGEARELLGAAMPLRADDGAGSYGEIEGARLRGAFEALHGRLGLKRTQILARETNDEVRSGIYEFPRELRKISELATSFLLELCRPSHLAVSPVLRGFYLTGVRPVVVSDVGASAPAPDTGPAGAAPVGATGVFDAAKLREQAQAPRPETRGSRRVPQWVFFERFFREAVLGDRTALALTGGGTRVDLLRRVGMGVLGALALVTAVGVTTSFVANRNLQSEVLAAARDVQAIGYEPGTAPSEEALQRMERLRVQLDRLREHAEGRPPLRLRWGLYRGSAVLPEARRIYFARFEPILWESTRARVTSRLAALDPEPSEADDYGESYELLRAYLVTTRHPERSTATLLTPALMRSWPHAGEVGEERRDLAHAQFAFFADELPHGHPLPRDADDALVARGRAFLGRFAERDRVYQALVSSASAEAEGVEFGRMFPGGGNALRNGVVVPGAFTEGGWARVHESLGDVDRLFAAEEWVLGAQAVSAEDRARLASELRERYVADYVTHWQEFLRGAQVPAFGGIPDAANKLERLSGNQSPILQVLAVTARNTAVDSVLVGRAFQPVHAVTPPDVRDRFIAEPNEAYVAGLVGLHSNLDQLAGATGPRRDQLLGQAASSAEMARLAARQLAQGFSIEGDARVVSTEVERLMQSPIAMAEALITRLPAAEVNQAGQAFCARFTPVLARYPFNPGATAEVGMDELAALFQPGESALWTFHQSTLSGLMVRQGNRYEPAPGAVPQPSRAFVEFFNRAAEVSRAFFDDRGGGPSVVFALRPQTSDAVPEIAVNIDGQSHRFTRTFATSQTFEWEGARAQTVRITGQVDGQEVTLLEAPPGPWALFRLFQRARWEPAGGGNHRLVWTVPGRQIDLAAELSFARGIPVFRPDFLGGLSCVQRIAE